MLHWRKLLVWRSSEGVEDFEYLGTLGEIVDHSDTSLGYICGFFEDGSPAWIQHYTTATMDERPDWDTPHAEVDWSGFREAVDSQC